VGRAELVEGEPGDDPAEVPGRLGDLRVRRGLPAEPGLLEDVLRLAGAPQHPVRRPEEAGPLGLVGVEWRGHGGILAPWWVPADRPTGRPAARPPGAAGRLAADAPRTDIGRGRRGGRGVEA